jgi:hypothetical protein
MKDAWGEIKDNNFANIRGWAIKFGEPTHNGNRMPAFHAYILFMGKRNSQSETPKLIMYLVVKYC